MQIPSLPGYGGGFSVASYNIHRCVGMDRRLDPERIGQVILELDADIVGLQEIDTQFYRRQETRQLDVLTTYTGLNVAMGATRVRGESHYGNAIFTRHPIVDVRRIDLSVPGREPRGALDVDISLGGERVRVIVAHLGLSASERRAQMQRLRNIFCEDRHAMEIMLGDFNEWFPRRRPLCRLHDYFGKPPSCRTFPSFFPFLALDRIWVRPVDALVEMCPHITPLSRVASDHLPVRADIAMPNGHQSGCDCFCQSGA